MKFLEIYQYILLLMRVQILGPYNTGTNLMAKIIKQNLNEAVEIDSEGHTIMNKHEIDLEIITSKLSDSDIEPEGSDDDKEEVAELSDWEKRLEALDSKPKKKVDQAPAEEKPAKKKGFFGRKKK